MRKTFVSLAVLVTIVGLLALVQGRNLAFASGTDHIGPIAGSTPDGGTCGNTWANDTYNLFFTVHNNGDGTFAVRTDYKDASFVTTGPVSPGKCETTNHHGSTVAPGITGNFQGFVDGTVTS